MLVWQDMPSGDNNTPDGVANFGGELERGDRRASESSVDRDVGAVQRRLGTTRDRKIRGADEGARSDTPREQHERVDRSRRRRRRRWPRVSRASGSGGGESSRGGHRRVRRSGLPMDGHTWLEKGNWGYRSFTTPEDLGTAYRDLMTQLRLQIANGAAAAIYTQTTDVEIEVNGLMTYDREVTKLSPAELSAWHAALYKTPPTLTTVLNARRTRPATGPTRRPSRPSGGCGRTSTLRSGRKDQVASDAPTRDGPTSDPMDDERSVAPTDVQSRRRPSGPPAPQDLSRRWGRGVRERRARRDIIWCDGRLHVRADYRRRKRALRAGPNTLAVHVHQERGGQYIDVGIVDVVEK